jgi:copper chaperone NosL
MGAEEAIPFSDRAAAERFAARHGGRVLALAGIPRDWALGGGGDDGATSTTGEPQAGSAPRHRH